MTRREGVATVIDDPHRDLRGVTVLKGFREFITRGNVIDLAVAVVIGTAFTAVVTAITESLVQPIIAALGGGNVRGLTTALREGNDAAVIDWAAITAALNFVIVAAVVYYIFVAPMNKFRELRAAGLEEEPDAPSDDILLLQEIRDLLRDRQGRI
jgi:large conductance mechanosensitive channel